MIVIICSISSPLKIIDVRSLWDSESIRLTTRNLKNKKNGPSETVAGYAIKINNNGKKKSNENAKVEGMRKDNEFDSKPHDGSAKE